jgi:hypothetical protein
MLKELIEIKDITNQRNLNYDNSVVHSLDTKDF